MRIPHNSIGLHTFPLSTPIFPNPIAWTRSSTFWSKLVAKSTAQKKRWAEVSNWSLNFHRIKITQLIECRILHGGTHLSLLIVSGDCQLYKSVERHWVYKGHTILNCASHLALVSWCIVQSFPQRLLLCSPDLPWRDSPSILLPWPNVVPERERELNPPHLHTWYRHWQSEGPNSHTGTLPPETLLSK